jgi:ATP-dependent helicase/DNAse subunit B
LDNIDKFLLLKKILIDFRKQNKIKIFSKSCLKRTFANNLLFLFDKFIDTKTSPEDLKNSIYKAKEKNTKFMIYDIYIIFNEYIEIIKKNKFYLDFIEDYFSEKIKESKIFKNSLIFIDEFDEFKNTDIKTICKLLKVVDKIYLSTKINIDSNINYSKLKDNDLFEKYLNIDKIKEIAFRAKELKFKEKIKFLEKVYDKKRIDFYLGNFNFCDFSKKIYENEKKGIYLYNLDGDFDNEIIRASDNIIKLLKNKIKPNNITVNLSNRYNYLNSLKKIFDKKDIKYFVQEKDFLNKYPITNILEKDFTKFGITQNKINITQICRYAFKSLEKSSIDIRVKNKFCEIIYKIHNIFYDQKIKKKDFISLLNQTSTKIYFVDNVKFTDQILVKYFM